MRRLILKCLPLGIVEILAKKICSIDQLPDGSNWYRVYDAKKPLKGAGVLIRKTNKLA